MHCKHCNSQINQNDIYCPKCGKKTQNVKENFRFSDFFKIARTEIRETKEHSFKFNFIQGMTALLFILVLIAHFFVLNYPSDILKYVIENFIYLLFVPVLLLPFGIQNVVLEVGYSSDLNKYMKGLYPKYLLFTAVNIAIFAVFKFLCIGDAILSLVRLTLVLWWLSVCFPIPVLMTKYKRNIFAYFKMSLKTFEDLRWQLFFGWTTLLIYNVMLILPFFVGYIRYGQITALTINKYVDNAVDKKLIKER